MVSESLVWKVWKGLIWVVGFGYVWKGFWGKWNVMGLKVTQGCIKFTHPRFNSSRTPNYLPQVKLSKEYCWGKFRPYNTTKEYDTVSKQCQTASVESESASKEIQMASKVLKKPLEHLRKLRCFAGRFRGDIYFQRRVWWCKNGSLWSHRYFWAASDASEAATHTTEEAKG